MTTDKDRFWEILKDVTVCMVTTTDDGILRSRPMAPYIDADARTIHFMTDADSAKIIEINADQDINLSFSDPDKMIFASVTAKGVVSTDKSLVKKFWGPYAEVFFGNDPETADAAVIQAIPSQAEFWDNSKGKLAVAAEMTRAYFSEHGPDLGDNAKLDHVA